MSQTPLERLLAAQKKAAAPAAAAPAAALAPAAAAAPAAVPAPAVPAAAPTTPTPAAAAAPALAAVLGAANGPEDLTAAAMQVQQAQAPKPAAAPVQPILTPAPAPTSAVATTSNAADSLPVHIRTEEEAKNAMVTLFGPDALSAGRSLADVADVEGSGMRLAWPFAQIRKGNWSIHKSCPEAIKEFMPVGGEGMPFYGVYIAHRVGVTIWQGDPQDGNPPVGAYVVPSPRTTQPPELADTILRETMKVGSKIQYTKGVDRDRLFPEGKLTPETHVLVWSPATSFILLVAPGYSSTQDTLNNFKGDIESKYPLWPLCFSLKKHETINKNAQPGDKNYKWEHFSVEAKLVANNARVQAVADAWAAYKSENMADVMNKAMLFLKGEDHSGLNVDEIVDLLAKYNQRIAALPQRKRN